MKIKLVNTRPEGSNITTFQFEAFEKVNYIAGQFIQMTLPHDNPDERGIKHWFTLSSSPTEPYVSITTKFYGDKSSSFKKTLFSLKPGDKVEINEPEGDFTLPNDASLELFFIAGGIGLTPFHSMVKFLQDTGEKRNITLLHSVQKANELAFNKLFKDYGATLVPYVGERVTTNELLKVIGKPVHKLIYLSGPEPMVEALTKSLVKAGLPENKLKSDYFPGYENNYSN